MSEKRSSEADEVFTVEEVAERLKVSPRTILRMVWDGRLPALKIGKQWRIRRETMTQLLRGTLRTEPEGGARRAATTPVPPNVHRGRRPSGRS